jgi:hypothetical protein
VPAASFKVESSTTIKAVTATAPAGKIDVRVTTGGGTSPISSTDHFTFLPTVTALSPAEGPAGLKVTVTGTGFATVTGATIIKFGNAKATEVECASSTSCKATAPVHAPGTVDVKATVNKATSFKNVPGDQFVYP